MMQHPLPERRRTDLAFLGLPDREPPVIPHGIVTRQKTFAQAAQFFIQIPLKRHLIRPLPFSAARLDEGEPQVVGFYNAFKQMADALHDQIGTPTVRSFS